MKTPSDYVHIRSAFWRETILKAIEKSNGEFTRTRASLVRKRRNTRVARQKEKKVHACKSFDERGKPANRSMNYLVLGPINRFDALFLSTGCSRYTQTVQPPQCNLSLSLSLSRVRASCSWQEASRARNDLCTSRRDLKRQ